MHVHLEKAIVAHVSAVLVEKTVACHHGLARGELKKVMAWEAHAVSHHAPTRHELQKVVDCEAHAVSRHALARHELEKALPCGG
jgi:hypothetical protein